MAHTLLVIGGVTLRIYYISQGCFLVPFVCQEDYGENYCPDFYFFIFMKLCAQAKEQPIKLKISQEHCQNNKQTRTRDRNQVETVYSGHRGDRDPVLCVGGVLLVAKLQGADAEMRQSWMWQNGWEDLS